MTFNRRSFLKTSGAGLLPVIVPVSVFARNDNDAGSFPPGPQLVKFFGDGESFEPGDYLSELQRANSAKAIERDRYGIGGAVAELEKKFVEITGKEKAIMMPSGTMANQFAISVLSGENTKVFVPDNSHMYRDEGDAAQSVFNKRLVPLVMNLGIFTEKDQVYYTARDLKKAIDSLPGEEVFKSGIGAVCIENPVRRADGKYVPIEEIKKISAYCRSNNIKLHLDGARLHIASAWTGVPVKEYASYFDTVYISLYKYLGASAGAVLCGDKDTIGKMPHLIKIHGGSLYGNWHNAAMALHRLQGFETRLNDSIKRSEYIFSELNKVSGVNISRLQGGTNIYNAEFPPGTDGIRLQGMLRKDFSVIIGRLNEKNQTKLTVNETLLYKDAEYIINAFKKSLII